MRRTTRLCGSVAAAASLVVLTGGVALADTLYNTLDASIENTAETTTVAVGSTKTVTLRVSAANSSAETGGVVNSNESCVVSAERPAWVDVSTSDVAKATVAATNPVGGVHPANRLIFTGCSDTDGQSITVTGVAAGAATITAAVNGASGRVNSDQLYTGPAAFTITVTGTGSGDPCATVSAPVEPTFTNGGSSWSQTAITPNANSAGATVTYATTLAGTFGAATEVGDGTHTVFARATGPAPCSKTSTSSQTFKVDTADPTATPDSVVNGTWRNSDLSQTFTFGDVLSGLAADQGLTGTGDFTLTASAESTKAGDVVTPTVVSKTVSDNAGRNVTRSVSALIDRTSPSITSPGNSTSWSRETTVSSGAFTASDSLSGLNSPAADASFIMSVSAESTRNAVGDVVPSSATTRTVSDVAGNSSTANFSALIDRTAPAVSANQSNSDWTNAAFVDSGSFTASDSLSGLADAAADASFTLRATAESTKVNNVIVPTSVTRNIDDIAGNRTTRSFSALIDRTAPTLTGTAQGAPGTTGWYRDDVTVTWAGQDGLSGIRASSIPVDSTVTGEGDNLSTGAKTVFDNAGNESDSSAVSVKIDRTAPTSSVSGVTANAVYATPPTVTCSATDQTGLSGVASHGTVTGNTTTAGLKSVSCSGATDNAGNTQTVASAFVNYTLAPAGGFNSNFDSTTNVLKVKPNQAIPLKWAFNDGTSNFALLGSAATLSSVNSNRCTVANSIDGSEPAAEVAAGASGLQLLPDISYQMNWKATSTTGCRALTLTAPYATGGGSFTRTILVNIVK